ncbi:MAG: hypothetical protein ACYC8T_21445 [Myxococcaceae bacterium]
MPKTTRLANRTVARKPADARPSTPAPSVTKPKKESAAPAAKKAPAAARQAPSSTVHFDVHPGLAEIRGYAESQGWLSGGGGVKVSWLELGYTTDGWKTSHVLAFAELPATGRYPLPGVAPGTEIEFALHVGVASGRVDDAGRGELWMNNGGRNYRQVTS